MFITRLNEKDRKENFLQSVKDSLDNKNGVIQHILFRRLDKRSFTFALGKLTRLLKFIEYQEKARF